MSSIELVPSLGMQAVVGERRRHPRQVFVTVVHHSSESNFYTGFTDDISQGGLFVATQHPQPCGARIGLVFSLPDGGVPICVTGEVRWIREYNPDSDGGPGMGVRFLNLMEGDRHRIQRFVEAREPLFYAE